ncbi:hypothetical protein B5E64_01555 [Drancourtella sp. An12]|uniref:hypothetical protein n=1 Tax=Drancourtella sp. An12 TaxID=1965548 RepID=UPI000B36778F|nr:hypothetical protein [Drancourtella sp. An12]OUQ47670.1 hypothetical protein B5E64_01555 [Drancourtella sp. An12]
MEQDIMKRFEKLNKACVQYPPIALCSLEGRGGYLNHKKKARIYTKPTVRAKDGFIEKFCL